MPNYCCLIRGYDFPGEVIGECGLHGFYTTRWVQALNKRRAELRAVDVVWRDPKLVPDGVTLPERARLQVEDVRRVEKLPRLRGGGATWFSQDEN